MSRELLGGDAGPPDDLPAVPSWDDDLSARPPSSDGQQPADVVPAHGPRWLAAAGLVAALVGAGLGWAGSGLGIAEPEVERDGVQEVWAVAQGNPSGPRATPSSVDTTIEVLVVNTSHIRQQVVGTAPDPLLAVSQVSLGPARQEVPPRDSVVLSMRLEVPCRSPKALDVPELLVRSEHGLRTVPVLGAASVLVDDCDEFFPGSVLRASVLRDGGALRLDLGSPTGRSFRLVGVEAAGVALEVEPGARPPFGRTSFWLGSRETTCPPSWQYGGLPDTLDLVIEGVHGDVATQSRARVTVTVGAVLRDWLEGRPCPAG